MTNLFIDIRKAEEKDIPAILEVDRLCFHSECWTRENVLYEMNENPVSNFWVICLSLKEDDVPQVVGFSDYWHTFDSATINKIAIHPYLHGRQLGRALMDEIYNDCFAKKVKTLTLEVRKSNTHAIHFYEKQEFKFIVEKPHYYSDGEDALYYVLEVK